MERKPPTVEDNPYSVLKLSATRLLHIREVQATGGGHFAQVARELGYTKQKEALPPEEEMRWMEQQLAQAEQVRRKRNESLVERLRAARERLGVNASMQPPAELETPIVED